MMCRPPLGARAICRTAAIVPIRRTSSGSGSSAESLFWSVRNSSRSPDSARFTDSMDAGRFTASGCSVSGKTTICLSATTGSSLG